MLTANLPQEMAVHDPEANDMAVRDAFELLGPPPTDEDMAAAGGALDAIDAAVAQAEQAGLSYWEILDHVAARLWTVVAYVGPVEAAAQLGYEQDDWATLLHHPGVTSVRAAQHGRDALVGRLRTLAATATDLPDPAQR